MLFLVTKQLRKAKKIFMFASEHEVCSPPSLLLLNPKPQTLNPKPTTQPLLMLKPLCLPASTC